MRLQVGNEGRTPSGHVVLPGAIKMVTNFVPIHLGNDYTKCLGKAGHLLVEGGGKLTMDFELDMEYRFKFNLSAYEAHLSLKDLDADKMDAKNHLRIRSGVIQGIGLFPKGR